MYDYYRARFSKILPPRRPRSRLGDGRSRIQLPRALRFVYGVSGFLAALGLLGASTLGGGSVWLVVPTLALPITLSLFLGFSEEQSWTRPLMVALMACAATAVWVASLHAVAIAVCAVTAVAALYLYTSPVVNAYYSSVSEQSAIRLKAADFKGAQSIPLYTGVAGLFAGGAIAYFLVIAYRGRATGLPLDDMVGLVGAIVLLGSAGAKLGALIGNALVLRWSRAA